MLVKVNGESRDCPPGTTISSLLVQLKLTPDKVAIELNRKLVRGSKYETLLQEGDELEIVTFVGGG